MLIRWLLHAVRDLESIHAYIADDNPQAARDEIDRILEAVSRLEANPGMGRPGRVPGTRELVVSDTPYLVAYRAKTGTIEILRVLHGARRWPQSIS